MVFPNVKAKLTSISPGMMVATCARNSMPSSPANSRAYGSSKRRSFSGRADSMARPAAVYRAVAPRPRRSIWLATDMSCACEDSEKGASCRNSNFSFLKSRKQRRRLRTGEEAEESKKEFRGNRGDEHLTKNKEEIQF